VLQPVKRDENKLEVMDLDLNLDDEEALEAGVQEVVEAGRG